MAVAGALLVYRRAMSRIVLPVLLVAVLLTAAVLPILGCSHNEVDIHDKLGSRLMALIDAEKRGEAESFAQSRLIDLVDGSVRVEIKVASGQLGAAVRAAADLGTVEVVADKMELVQALISGDIRKIESWLGKLDKRHATWLWCRLSQEKW